MTRQGATAAVVAAAFLVPAQALQNTAPFRARTDLVALNVTVLDEHDQFVGGLSRDAFAVTEDGVPRSIEQFTSDPAALSMVLAVDASESMTGQRFAFARQAVLKFFERQGRDDEIALIGFNDSVFSIAPWTKSAALAETALERIRPVGTTSLYGAVVEAVAALRDSRLKRQAVVVISDGNDFRLSDVSNRASVPPSQLRQMLALQQLERTEALVYAIGIDAPSDTGATPDKTFDGNALRKLTEPTGGFSIVVRAPGDVPAAAARIADELRHQYLIGFAPAHVMDGKFHHVKVKVAGCKCRVRARAGFSAAR